MKKIIIVDVDGTVSIMSDRSKLLEIEPIDWLTFYDRCLEDKPNDSVIELVNVLAETYEIIFCTGRRDYSREKTWEWIKKHFYNWEKFNPNIIMRKTGDTRYDHIVKPEMLKESGIDTDRILFFLEDKTSVVNAWRDLGFTCLQVDNYDKLI